MNVHRTEVEAANLRAIWTRTLLDSQPELECDELVQLVSALCGTPIGLVTLLDERHQWVRASEHLKMGGTPREAAFCAHAIRETGLFLVKDALMDARFASNPLVTAEPAIRFFAGVGLFSRVLAKRFARVTAVEASPVAAKDLGAALKKLGPQHRALQETTLEFLRRAVLERPGVSDGR